MIVTDLNDNIIFPETVVTIGKFDGFHLGHKKLIDTLNREKEDLKSVVFTFRTDSEEKHVKNLNPLLNEVEKEKLFSKNAVDYYVLYDLTEERAAMEPEEFVGDVLVKRLNAKKIVCGDDFRFGRDRKGDVILLSELESKYGFMVIIVKREEFRGIPISSTRIREALKSDKELASKMLGRPVK